MAKKRLRLSDARNEWAERSRRRRSKSTIANYLSALNQLEKACGGDIWLDNVTPVHINKVLDLFEHAPTSNLRLSQYRGFFTWCIRNGYLHRSPTDPIDSRPVMSVDGDVQVRLSPDLWEPLLDAAGAYHPLDRALVAVGLFLGQRGMEVRHLKVGDLNRDSDDVIRSITVTKHKVHRTSNVPVCPELADEMETWLTWYGTHSGDDLGRLPDNATLFPPRRASISAQERVNGRLAGHSSDAAVEMWKTMSDTTHRDAIKRALRKIGVDARGEAIHTLRRSVATALYEEETRNGGHDHGMDIVQELLGHQARATTERYIGKNLRKKRLEDRFRKPMFSKRPAGSATVIPITGTEGP